MSVPKKENGRKMRPQLAQPTGRRRKRKERHAKKTSTNKSKRNPKLNRSSVYVALQKRMQEKELQQ
jgi:hypothetical protein